MAKSCNPEKIWHIPEHISKIVQARGIKFVVVVIKEIKEILSGIGVTVVTLNNTSDYRTTVRLYRMDYRANGLGLRLGLRV